MRRTGLLLLLLFVAGRGEAQTNPFVPPERIAPLPGAVAVVLPLPEDFRLPPAVARAATRLLVLVPYPVVGKASLPPDLEALRRRVPTEARVQRRPPYLAPVVLGPNYAYLPGGGWTDLASQVGIFWRVFNEAWSGSGGS